MALFNFTFPLLEIKPPPPAGTIAAITHSSESLKTMGFNMQVFISVFMPEDVNRSVPKSVTVMGQFDTGARITSIDIKLAEFLGLVSIGSSKVRTANGIAEAPNFIANLAFPNTGLKAYEGIRISSCNLGFDVSRNSNYENLGILIGRDIMSRWNIVWNGPTSSVFIAD